MHISYTEAISNMDLQGYLEALALYPSGHWIVRYHNTDPDNAYAMVFQTSGNPWNYNCPEGFISIEGTIISGGLPTDGLTYSLQYYSP
jgi:hypothetical protein